MVNKKSKATMDKLKSLKLDADIQLPNKYINKLYEIYAKENKVEK